MTLFELSACRLTSTHNGGRATDTQVDNEVGDDDDDDEADDDEAFFHFTDLDRMEVRC